MEYYYKKKRLSSIGDFLKAAIDAAQSAANEIHDIVRQLGKVGDKIEFFHDDNGKFLIATRHSDMYYLWVARKHIHELSGKVEYVSVGLMHANEYEFLSHLEYVLTKKAVDNFMERLGYDMDAPIPCNGKELSVNDNRVSMSIPFDNKFPFHPSLMVKIDIVNNDVEGS